MSTYSIWEKKKKKNERFSFELDTMAFHSCWRICWFKTIMVISVSPVLHSTVQGCTSCCLTWAVLTYAGWYIFVYFWCGMSPFNRAVLFCHITELLIRAKLGKCSICSAKLRLVCPGSSSVSWLLTWASGLKQEAMGWVLIGLARLTFICSHTGEHYPTWETHPCHFSPKGR